MTQNILLEQPLDFLVDAPSGKVADRLAEKIRYMIVAGKLPAGYVFPNENEFCSYLNVGRSSLREAYHLLENNGFITRTKRGTFVNNDEEIATKMPFNVAVEMSDFEDLLEFRLMIEAQIAGFAAKRASAEDLAELEQSVTAMEQGLSDITKLTYADTMFHLGMAKASHNRLLEHVMRTAIEPFSASIYHIFNSADEEIQQRALASHKNILQAVKEQDEKEAKRRMRRHIEDVQYSSDSYKQQIKSKR